MPSDTERRLPPVFPTRATLFSGRKLGIGDLVAIDTLVGAEGPIAGYLVAEGERDALYLLFLKGKAYSAGVYRDGTLENLTIREFFSLLLKPGGGERTFDLFAVDPAVLLLVAVHFQKRPVLSVSTDLASPEEILGKVEEAGRDAIIALVDGPLRHVVFCQKGRPARFHAAGDVAVPKEDALDEAVTVFCFERGGKRPVTLEVYDDLEVSPAPDHGVPLARYAALGGNLPRFELALFDGANPVETRIFQVERCVFGRADSADLKIEDSAVSREHAAIQLEKGRLVLRDLGSDNGTWVNDEQITGPRPLQAGDEIRVGRTRLVFRALPVGGGNSGEETLHLDSSELGARLMHVGQTYPIGDRGLILGSGGEVDIALGGLWVRPRQLRVFRSDDGSCWVEHLGGWRSLTINGRATKRCKLTTGDTIRIASETLRFYDSD
ncbi:MAG: FHA domain-containing protein [Deltaproteobacteria bacterium]|nr:FHA domain-containing protein [Deltaproteobacteria bacterium]